MAVGAATTAAARPTWWGNTVKEGAGEDDANVLTRDGLGHPYGVAISSYTGRIYVANQARIIAPSQVAGGWRAARSCFSLPPHHSAA